jgi:GrpB-like predicted nucleotidyltransferase (UPF0157 family)
MPSSPDFSSRRPDVAGVELVGGVEKRSLTIVEYDPIWPSIFNAQLVHIEQAPGNQALSIEHIGSTSVPGLAAKPIVDILVTFADITAEADYLSPLLDVGYGLRVREPGHRMVRTPALDVHIHLLEGKHPRVEAYLQFRNSLRKHAGDRDLYARTKRELLSHEWPDMNAYGDAKTEVINVILARSRARAR